MSASRYSRFKSKDDENFYDALIFKLIQILARKLLETQFLRKQSESEGYNSKDIISEQLNWIKKVLKIEKALYKLETGEDVIPMSKAFSELVNQL